MKLADLAAVLQIAPLILTALSVVLYRESGRLAALDRDRRRLRRRAVRGQADAVELRRLGADRAGSGAGRRPLRELLTRRIEPQRAGAW